MPRKLFFLVYLQLNYSIVLRFQKLQDHNKKMNSSTSSGIECQAAKRQKLEGGSLHKVCKFDYSTSSCDYLITEEVTVMFVSEH